MEMGSMVCKYMSVYPPIRRFDKAKLDSQKKGHVDECQVQQHK